MVQDEVARTIVSTLFGRIQEVSMERSSRMPPASLTAYDCLLRGIAHFRSEGEGENERACEMFERAIALDPNYGLAHSYLALVRTTMHGSATAPSEVLNAEFARARHGLDLDPQEGRCHRILSTICLLRREYDMADQLVRQALLLNPSDADNLMQKGRVLAMRGRPEEALE
ncbi:tetratricopeptide repeat protein, partial [Rhizobiaceae sp. 2RAB30]